MFGPRQFCVQKDFGSKKIMNQKKFRVQNIFGLQYFVQKCRSKKIQVKKQIFGPKDFWFEKVWVKKKFGPKKSKATKRIGYKKFGQNWVNNR